MQVGYCGVSLPDKDTFFEKRDYYSDATGKYNLWMILDENWRIVCDKHRNPIELSRDYVNLLKKDNKNLLYRDIESLSVDPNFPSDFDGYIAINPVPKKSMRDIDGLLPNNVLSQARYDVYRVHPTNPLSEKVMETLNSILYGTITLEELILSIDRNIAQIVNEIKRNPKRSELQGLINLLRYVYDKKGPFSCAHIEANLNIFCPTTPNRYLLRY